MLSPLPRRSDWDQPCSSPPVVSAFPEMAVVSACATSFSRIAQRSLTLRPVHSRCHRILWHASPEASTILLPPQLLRLLPAGAVAGWDFHPRGERRLCTAHAKSGHCIDFIQRAPNSKKPHTDSLNGYAAGNSFSKIILTAGPPALISRWLQSR